MDLPPRQARYLIITEQISLLSLIAEQGIFAYRKTCLIRDCNDFINVFSSLELSLKPRVRLNGSKESCELAVQTSLAPAQATET